MGLESNLEDIFPEIRARALEGPVGWKECRNSLGLGRDAFRAFRATSNQAFEAITKWLADSHGHSVESIFDNDLESSGSALSIYHQSLREAAGTTTFWPLLAHGITMLISKGGLPSLSDELSPLVVDYDHELALLSPAYAALRIHACNDGVRVTQTSGGVSWFAPEIRISIMTKEYVNHDPNGVPHTLGLNISHDTVHMAAFGDAYWGAWCADSEYQETLIAAEEASVAFDTVVVRDLFRHRQELALVDIYSSTESASRHGTPKRVLQQLASDGESAQLAQKFLVGSALAHLHGQEQPIWSGASTEPFAWISQKAVQSHAAYWSRFARLANENRWRAELARPATLSLAQINRARLSLDQAWGTETPSWLAGLEFSAVSREQALRLHGSRQRLSNFADVLDQSGMDLHRSAGIGRLQKLARTSPDHETFIRRAQAEAPLHEGVWNTTSRLLGPNGFSERYRFNARR